jgi:diguanylate cyclase (GGDEF)-like protein
MKVVAEDFDLPAGFKLFEDVARALFESTTVEQGGAASVHLLRTALHLHRAIFLTTYTGSAELLSYDGDERMTALDVERCFRSRESQLSLFLGLRRPVFMLDYPMSPAPLQEFVDTGTRQVALIPYVSAADRPLGLITLHQADGYPIWTEYEQQLMVAVSQLIFMGVERLYHLEEHQRLLHVDELTGVGNRRAFVRDLEAALAAGSPFSLMVVDFDGFKRINDTQGHLVGDEVLRRVAGCLSDAFQPPHQVYRLGGDEFALYVADANPDTARLLLVDARAQIARRCARLVPTGVWLSVGTAEASVPGSTLDDLVALADRQMYAVKRERRQIARGFDADLG